MITRSKVIYDFTMEFGAPTNANAVLKPFEHEYTAIWTSYGGLWITARSAENVPYETKLKGFQRPKNTDWQPQQTAPDGAIYPGYWYCFDVPKEDIENHIKSLT